MIILCNMERAPCCCPNIEQYMYGKVGSANKHFSR